MLVRDHNNTAKIDFRLMFGFTFSWEKSFSIDLMGHVEIVIPILKNCLVDHDRFKRHILFLELKTVKKIQCPRKRIFKAARDESYFIWSAWPEEKIEGRRSETYVAADVDANWEKDGQGLHTAKHNKYSLQTKTQKPADKYFQQARETPREFVALVIVLRFLLVNKKWS